MLDPRENIINKRLEGIKRIIAVSSGKGGVGKSLVASTLALTLARRSFRVGLFDVDFTSPSTHLILGAKDVKPEEEKGIIPAKIHGLKYVSIVAYSKNRALPLRGADASNALIELFAMTIWKDLDFLVIDMPPGISDATLDVIRLVKGIKFLIVTTPSPLAFETVKKLLELLTELRIPVVGIVENMKMKENPFIRQNVGKSGIPFLGDLSFDQKVEEALGDAEALLKTDFAKKLAEIVSKISFDV